MKQLIQKPTTLGFSEYEAKAYLALLRSHPATAYEVSRASGIPTSKIYQVLDRLVERGMVAPAASGKARRFMPLDPDEFLGRYKNTVEQTVDALRHDLSHLSEQAKQSSIWNITDGGYLIDKAIAMIDEAKTTLMLSLCKEELALLEPALAKALKRKVRVAIVHFGVPESKLRQIYAHPIEETIYEEKGGRGIVVVRDSAEVLTGTIMDGGRVEGAWSTNQGFVTLAEDYIKHDVYIMKIVRRFDAELVRKFGPHYAKLRDIFVDEEEQ